MFGAFPFGSGYFGQGPLGGATPAVFVLDVCCPDAELLSSCRLAENLEAARDAVDQSADRLAREWCEC